MNDASLEVPQSATPVDAYGAGIINKTGHPKQTPQMRFILWSFTAATFISALLLFSVQPMFAKMVLPVLGGSPSVWAVAIFFFQAALLVGYCYAHLLIGRVPLRVTGFVHLGVCLLALLTLPMRLPAGWTEPPPGEPYMWQLGLFTVAIGLPFLAVAANAPLLQAWFARTGHPQGNDPYFLYAASNLGSLIALLGYPFLLEPTFGLKALARVWTLGFLVLMAALILTFLLMLNRQGEASSVATPTAADAPGAAPTWGDRLGWVGLALVPAALLTAFTTHVTTDIASAPLLWVLPLSLYLLTFVLVFREKSLIRRDIMLFLHLICVAIGLLVISQTKHESWFVTAATGVAVFFTSAMVAHRTLYEARPAARYLTQFYLWMSLGGALGGLSAALIAPKIFSEVFEYPLLLALSMACRPGVINGDALRRLWGTLRHYLGRRAPAAEDGGESQLTEPDKQEILVLWLVVAGGILTIYWVPWAIGKFNLDVGEWGTTIIVVGLLTIVLIAGVRRPLRQLTAALLIFCALVWLPSAVKRGEAQRSYFGVYRVQTSGDGDYHTLIHGTTLHGAQRIRDEQGNRVDDPVPATYYYDKSPIAQTVAKVRERLGDKKGRYGVTGLGAGSLSCHSKEGEVLALLRDRSGDHRHRQRSALLHVPEALPAQARHRARRRAPDHGQGSQLQLRSHHRRCVLLGRRARAPDDGGGAAALFGQGEGQRHRSPAYLQPLSRPRVRSRRDRKGAAGRAGVHRLG